MQALMNVENVGALRYSNQILKYTANVVLINLMPPQEHADDTPMIQVSRGPNQGNILILQLALHIRGYKTEFMKLGEKRKANVDKEEQKNARNFNISIDVSHNIPRL